jgi:hypothetical protein
LEAVSNAILAAALVATAGLGGFLLFSNEEQKGRDTPAEIAAVALYLTLVVVRAPTLLSFYRLWAETPGLYFVRAYEHGPLAGLLNTASNYYDLSANLASAVAAVVGLRWWPVVDTGFGLAAAAALPFVLLGLGFTFRQRIAILIAVSTAIFCVTASETFGTVLHNKGWGAVYTAIVLTSIAMEPDAKSTFRRVLLLILPLTGTIAVFALVSWAAAAAILRLRSLIRPLGWALPGLAVQVLCLALPAEHTGFAVRPLSLSTLVYIPDLFAVKAGAAIVVPSLFFRSAIPGPAELLLTAALSAAFVLVALYAASRRRYLALVPLVAMGVFYGSAALAVGGAGLLLEAGSSFRYYFPPVAILLIALALSCLRFCMPVKATFVALCMVAVAANHSYNIRVSSLFFTPHEWDWTAQAEAHLSSPKDMIRIYPPGGGLHLPACGEYHC